MAIMRIYAGNVRVAQEVDVYEANQQISTALQFAYQALNYGVTNTIENDISYAKDHLASALTIAESLNSPELVQAIEEVRTIFYNLGEGMNYANPEKLKEGAAQLAPLSKSIQSILNQLQRAQPQT